MSGGERLPEIIGVRHHSPACARLVAARIRALAPRHVLIEGPADFNERLDELFLPHRLPLAIYSHLSCGTAHRGSWSPFAEHSPEWQALTVAREVGAQPRFIDLPAWHDAFADTPNRYADAPDADHERVAQDYETALAAQLSIDGRDALWDRLFESPELDVAELGTRLATYFEHVRNVDPGSPGNQARETMMARWIAWAMRCADGPVLVVCGGYHAPALARRWREPDIDCALPAVPQPVPPADDTAPLRYGSYLVPYGYRRLDAFAGYASGMSSPTWYQWTWERGAGAGPYALQQVLERLRGRKLPASTADVIGLHARAQALARLRGHATPLRTDWLDAIAGALVKDALDVALPWSYRGPIRAGTDPVLVEVMDVFAGDAYGELAPGTPQPPLVHSVAAELAALNLTPPATIDLDLLDDHGRARSRVLHRLALLDIPGVERRAGPSLALSGERREAWSLRAPLEQQAALIEAGAYGPTLLDAARARLEERLRAAHGHIEPMADLLNLAAFAGIGDLSDDLLAQLPHAIAAEPSFEAIGAALATLHPLYRHGDALQMRGAAALRTVLGAAFDRGLWLLEAPGRVVPGEHLRHLRAVAALRDLLRDALAADGTHDLALETARGLAVFERKARSVDADPLSRGAALGATFSLQAGHAQAHDDVASALRLLGTLAPPQLGDALAGLIALAREQLSQEPSFVAGLDALVQSLDDADFVAALPALRGAFAWLPPRERGALAHAVLGLHDAAHLSHGSLTRALPGGDAQEIAAAALLEQQVLQRLKSWGVFASAAP